MNGNIDNKINRAFFISPIVNMEKLITDMMSWANVTEEQMTFLDNWIRNNL